MAVGDEAATAGLSVVPATADVRQGYVAINERGDELARHMASGTHPFTRITGQAQTAQIADFAVTTAKLAVGAVTNERIGLEAVTATRLAPNAVTNTRIADGAVSPLKLAKRTAAGVTTLTNFMLGTVIETGLSGTVAMVITPRNYGSNAFYAAIPQNTSGRFLVKAWADDDASAAINWIAMEV